MTTLPMVTAEPVVWALPQQPPVSHIQMPRAPVPAITDQNRIFIVGFSSCGLPERLPSTPVYTGSPAVAPLLPTLRRGVGGGRHGARGDRLSFPGPDGRRHRARAPKS
jgi:hypothetical protein